jgi:hypothetical protein
VPLVHLWRAKLTTTAPLRHLYYVFCSTLAAPLLRVLRRGCDAFAALLLRLWGVFGSAFVTPLRRLCYDFYQRLTASWLRFCGAFAALRFVHARTGRKEDGRVFVATFVGKHGFLLLVFSSFANACRKFLSGVFGRHGRLDNFHGESYLSKLQIWVAP